MGTITDEQKLNALIEEYKMINEEVSNYQKEMIRCFLYSVVVLAIGLGYGIKEGDISCDIVSEKLNMNTEIWLSEKLNFKPID